MALVNTNLIIQMGQLAPDFFGNPNDLAVEMVRRMKIVSPTGTNFFFTGDTEPTSNLGPWLKNGTQWWVWSVSLKRYIPLDISASQVNWYWMSNSTPPNSTPPLWLKTTQDQTETDPSHGQPIGWYEFNGTNWVPFIGIVLSGTTANRPAGAVEYQQYYDTDISVLIWWERSQWRTISGVPGDIKYVIFPTLSLALLQNPGWDLFAAGNQNLRGRIIMQASKNADGSNPVSVPPNVAQRGAGETFGETDFVAINDSALESAPKTATQALFVVTASAPFFNAQMVGQQIVFANGSPTVTIATFTDSTHVTVNISQSVLATVFSIPGSNVPYPPQLAAWALVKL